MTPADYAHGLTTREQFLLQVLVSVSPGAELFTHGEELQRILDMREWGLLVTYDGEAEGSVYATITPLGREVFEMRRKMDEEKRS